MTSGEIAFRVEIMNIFAFSVTGNSVNVADLCGKVVQNPPVYESAKLGDHVD